MTPFSLLPHWFQRRYRVWRGWLSGFLFWEWRRTCCRWGSHRMTIDSKPHRITKGVGYQPPCMFSRCVDCGACGEEHELVESPRRTVRRGA